MRGGACRGQRSAVGDLPQAPCALSLGSGSPLRIAWLVSVPRGSLCRHFFSAGITGACHHVQLFTWVLGIELWSTCFADGAISSAPASPLGNCYIRCHRLKAYKRGTCCVVQGMDAGQGEELNPCTPLPWVSLYCFETVPHSPSVFLLLTPKIFCSVKHPTAPICITGSRTSARKPRCPSRS